MRIAGIAFVTICALLVAASSARAGSIEFSATDRGWYHQAGGHTASNTFFSTGWHQATGLEFRSFFVYDLSPLSGHTIKSATVIATFPTDGYHSSDSQEGWELYDYTGSISSLVAGGSGKTDIYSDLGSGTSYGIIPVTNGMHPSTASYDLGSEFVSALNAASGEFAFGSALSTLTKTPGTDEMIFWGSGTVPAPKLRLTFAPLPSAGLLGLTMLGGLAVVRRLRRRKA